MTPAGKRSKTKRDGADGLVVEMSYEELANLVQQGRELEQSIRGRVIADEFLECINRLLRRSSLMATIQNQGFSEASRMYMTNVGAIEAVKEQAVEECAAFLEWMAMETSKRLKAILGAELVCRADPDGEILAFLPTWTAGETRYGIAFLSDYSMRNRTFGDQAGGHWVAVRITGTEGEVPRKNIAEPVSRRLSQILRKVWPHTEDCDAWDYNDALLREFPIPSNGDF